MMSSTQPARCHMIQQCACYCHCHTHAARCLPNAACMGSRVRPSRVHASLSSFSPSLGSSVLYIDQDPPELAMMDTDVDTEVGNEVDTRHSGDEEELREEDHNPEARELISGSQPNAYNCPTTLNQPQDIGVILSDSPKHVRAKRGSFSQTVKKLAQRYRKGSSSHVQDVNSTSRHGDDHVVAVGHVGKPTCRQHILSFFLPALYLMLALVAVVVTYSMLANLVHAMQHPVRSIFYNKVQEHEAPGIAIYPGGASFPACGHYFQNVVTSKVRLSQLDLVNKSCSYVNLTYEDPHYPGIKRNAVVIRGPSKVLSREATFLHFRLVDPSRDFFTVSYFLFPGWDRFNASSRKDQVKELLYWHEFVPTFALGAGFRFWTKISVKETYFFDEEKHIEFKTEYSVIRHWDKRPLHIKNKTHLFFIFFEWKNNIVEQSFVLYTTSPWSIGAGLCGVFLTLHKAYSLLKASVRKARKEKMKLRSAKQLSQIKEKGTCDSSVPQIQQYHPTGQEQHCHGYLRHVTADNGHVNNHCCHIVDPPCQCPHVANTELTSATHKYNS